jgi:hypothetical protein
VILISWILILKIRLTMENTEGRVQHACNYFFRILSCKCFCVLGFFFFFKLRSCYAAETDLELLGSKHPSASASQVTGATGMCHHTCLSYNFLN